MRELIGFTILITFFASLHILIIYQLGIKGLWAFLAYPITALLVLAVYLLV